MTLGQRIKQLRELKNLTQDFMGDQLGITQSSYSKLEKRDDIPKEKLEKIARILGVSSSDIVSLDEKVVFNLMNNKNAKGLVINQMSLREKNIYEDYIKSLKEEISHLKQVIEKLLKTNKRTKP